MIKTPRFAWANEIKTRLFAWDFGFSDEYQGAER